METLDLMMEGVSEEDWNKTMSTEKLVKIIEEGNLVLLKKLKSKLSGREKIDGQKQGISRNWSRLVRYSTLRAVLINEKDGLDEEKALEILQEVIEGVDSRTIRNALSDRDGHDRGSLFVEMGSNLNTKQLNIFRQKLTDEDWNAVMLSHDRGRNAMFYIDGHIDTLQFILDNTENDVLVEMLNTNSYGKDQLPLFFYIAPSKQNAKYDTQRYGCWLVA